MDWTSSELAQLERILFYENTLDNEETAVAEQFVKISALFPTKCIHDIAQEVTQIKKARTSGSLTINANISCLCIVGQRRVDTKTLKKMLS